MKMHIYTRLETHVRTCTYECIYKGVTTIEAVPPRFPLDRCFAGACARNDVDETKSGVIQIADGQ